MAEPELGGFWRRLPHEATRAEFDRWEKEQAELNLSTLRNPPLADIAVRRDDLQQSGMVLDQVDRTMERQRAWDRLYPAPENNIATVQKPETETQIQVPKSELWLLRGPRRVHAERDSPAWKAAWDGLAEIIKRDRLGDGKDIVQSDRDGENWQYMGSALTPRGNMWHEFRHRNHPITQTREYRDVVTDKLDTQVQQQVQRPRRGWSR